MSIVTERADTESNTWLARFPTLAIGIERVQQSALWMRLRRSPYLLFGGIFALGLLIGGLVLGLFVLSARPDSSQFPPAYERMYMTWVADRYAQSNNVAQARQDLALWTREDIVRVITTLQAEQLDLTTRSRIEVLAMGLGVSAAGSSTRSSILTQPIFLVSIFLPVILMLSAMGVIVVPMLRERFIVNPVSLEMSEEDAKLAELLADVQIGTLDQGPDAQAQEKPEEKKEEPPPAPQDAEDSPSSGLGDLASLFEEEDTSISTLEKFCKGMADIKIEDLAGLSQHVLERFLVNNSRASEGKR
jgi:hypothetical protein